MTDKLFNIFILALIARSIGASAVLDLIDVSKYTSIYYDPVTGAGLKGEIEDSIRQPMSKIVFRGLPCQCEGLGCGCCVGVNISSINFDRRACTNFTYDPYEFAINTALLFNEREIVSGSISAKNPPPLCVPFPYLPFVSFCVRFYDVYTPGRNLHACLDLETRVASSPVLILHFNCIQIGADGVSLQKPGEEATPKPEVSEAEIYDEVNFEPEDVSVYASTSTLTPEEENNIGQLKL